MFAPNELKFADDERTAIKELFLPLSFAITNDMDLSRRIVADRVEMAEVCLDILKNEGQLTLFLYRDVTSASRYHANEKLSSQI